MNMCITPRAQSLWTFDCIYTCNVTSIIPKPILAAFLAAVSPGYDATMLPVVWDQGKLDRLCIRKIGSIMSTAIATANMEV